MTLTLFNGSNGENILGKRYRWTSSLFQRTIEQQQPVSKYHKNQTSYQQERMQ